MKWTRKNVWLLFGFLSVASLSFGASTEEQTFFLPSDMEHIHWSFSGVISDEEGERYGYYFQMYRNGEQYQTMAALIDAETSKLVLFDEAQTAVGMTEPYYWEVGRTFLSFNPVNASWIFGLKTQDDRGFNFKIDMLAPDEHATKSQALTPNMNMLMTQTGRLNGHFRLGHQSEEHFVTAKNTWFRQLSLKNVAEPVKHEAFSALLCRFDDDSAFYFMNLTNEEALRGSIAGWSDVEMKPQAISQFIDLHKSEDDTWHIGISSPKQNLVFADVMKQGSIAAGFLKGEKSGFCALSKEIV